MLPDRGVLSKSITPGHSCSTSLLTTQAPVDHVTFTTLLLYSHPVSALLRRRKGCPLCSGQETYPCKPEILTDLFAALSVCRPSMRAFWSNQLPQVPCVLLLVSYNLFATRSLCKYTTLRVNLSDVAL